jgi:hypothetical protein
MSKIMFLFFLCSIPVFAQGIRIGDNMPISSATTPGGPLSAAENALISFCSFPGNASPCTNKAVTFTDQTLTTACPSSTQVVLATTNTCVGTTDGYGNWGVWVAAGNYSFTVTLSSGQSLGPYAITVSASQGVVLINGNSLLGGGPANLINGTGPGGVGISNTVGNQVSFGLVNFAGSQGAGAVTATYTNQQTNDVLCFNASGIVVNCTLGVPIVQVSTTPIPITTFMRGNELILSASAAALTIAQAGSTGFGSNFELQIWNSSAGAVTLTPSTSTITGGSTNVSAASAAVINSGDSCILTSDGVNYYMPCMASKGTNCAAIGTSASPSVASCGAAATGHFSCATNATGATCQINTTAVTAKSEIFVFESDTTATGTAVGVTCNTSTAVNPASRLLASYVAGTSFTINLGTVTTNPACFSYQIVN